MLSIFSMLTVMSAMIAAPSSCGPTYVQIGSQDKRLSSGETATICVDVSEKETKEVLAAITAWDASINRWRQLIPKIGKNLEDCDYTITETDPGPDIEPLTLASTNSLFGREISLYRGRYDVDTVGVVLHELGHAFGARHMAGTMMNPQIIYFKYKCPDAATIAQVAVANGVDPARLSWCIQTS